MESLVAVGTSGNTVVCHEVCKAASVVHAQEFEVRIEFVYSIWKFG